MQLHAGIYVPVRYAEQVFGTIYPEPLPWIVEGFSVVTDNRSHDVKKQKICRQLIFIHWSRMFSENMMGIVFTSWSVPCVDCLFCQLFWEYC